MKRIIHFGLSLLLVVSTMGVTINRHYSGGELFSTSLFAEPESCCAAKCDCCHEESQVIKVEDDFIGSAFDLIKVFFFELVKSTLNVEFSTLDEQQISKNISTECDKSPPPDKFIQEFTQSFLL